MGATPLSTHIEVSVPLTAPLLQYAPHQLKRHLSKKLPFSNSCKTKIHMNSSGMIIQTLKQ